MEPVLNLIQECSLLSQTALQCVAPAYNELTMDEIEIQDFRQLVRDYYHAHGRHDLPWRQPEASGEFSSYKIMVSEIMLQQTQVARVVEKYQQFLELFPSVDALAAADLGDVLRAWSGLGYNRRAKFLHQAAQKVVNDFDNVYPQTPEQLITLPGIGKNTAGAILVYAFNKPVLFVETNIRTVYIHHFFDDQNAVDDKNILNMLSITLDEDNPREWYWALMDYGSYLKQSGIRRNHQSKHYTKQSQFEGSKRQVRGEVLRALAAAPQSLTQLKKHIDDIRLEAVVNDLITEGLITKKESKLSL